MVSTRRKATYNPYDVSKEVQIDVGTEVRDLYDAATDGFLKRNVKGLTTFHLDANAAAVVVLTPAGGTVTHNGNKSVIKGVIVDYVRSSGVRKHGEEDSAALEQCRILRG